MKIIGKVEDNLFEIEGISLETILFSFFPKIKAIEFESIECANSFLGEKYLNDYHNSRYSFNNQSLKLKDEKEIREFLRKDLIFSAQGTIVLKNEEKIKVNYKKNKCIFIGNNELFRNFFIYNNGKETSLPKGNFLLKIGIFFTYLLQKNAETTSFLYNYLNKVKQSSENTFYLLEFIYITFSLLVVVLGIFCFWKTPIYLFIYFIFLLIMKVLFRKIEKVRFYKKICQN